MQLTRGGSRCSWSLRPQDSSSTCAAAARLTQIFLRGGTMQVFVAGATGTIGASLIKQLLTSGQAAQDIRAVRVRRTAWWGLPRQRQSQARTALASGATSLPAR